MRVVSRTPCPARRSEPSGASTKRPASRLATSCGTCETSATARSCSSGVISIGVAPRSRARPSTRARSAAGRLLVAADHPGAADEEVGAGGDRSAALAPGERVRADVAGEVDAALAQRVQRLELDARDVGDDGLGEARELRAR